MLFPAWETFYIVLGSAAGALTGLMFVVVALIANVSFGTEDALRPGRAVRSWRAAKTSRRNESPRCLKPPLASRPWTSNWALCGCA
jgi:hypothetical protein